MTSISRTIRNVGAAAAISAQAMKLGASQNYGEMREALALVMAERPRVMAEIGCDRGGTLFAWTRVCPEVYGITLEANADSGGARCEEHGAFVRYGDSHDQRQIDWLRDSIGLEKLDILVIDGDHHLEGVLADLGAYGPMVRAGGLIMMHDVAATQFPEVHVHKAWGLLRARLRTTQIGDVLGWGIIKVREDDDIAAAAAEVAGELGV
jgi:cephalosporin hydroxylase